MMLDIWQQLQSFMGRGGPVLWVILALLVLMWILMIERLLYLNLGFGPLQQQLLGRWQARSERHGWHARAIRGRWLAQAELELNRHLIFIRTLVVLCPMLGLLGTVTGMIGVFDALAAANRFNPESMAGGISRATIPTMAGMVVALSGVLLLSRLESQAKRALAKTRDGLREEKVMQ
ncbi:MotA/TolQ/ExbB proton channel family protein [Aeromonas salmonicida]|uniref:MotA/TolQ/ExbB proton channel family protein n=1 Tax=Aeromonas salmonicida TaxID=645 RepID=A0AAX3VRE7_AERSA|nr:MotA/TolQ/ExbB proton channel family protein [Aeromonas salmonicida]WHF35398.1 MotA/TolQ/ExbB proton channel family protein [Aeromonas salmonicida]